MNFVPIRFSTYYHNKAICRRTLILRALFGGLFCYFNIKAIYNGNVVTWSDVPILLATSFDNNWHFVLIFPPAQKHLLYFSYKHLTINWLDKTKHVFQTTFKASHTFSKRLFTVIHTFSKRLSGAKLIFYIRLSKYFHHFFTFALSFSILFIYLC